MEDAEETGQRGFAVDARFDLFVLLQMYTLKPTSK